jgi:HlyD family secretion protein
VVVTTDNTDGKLLPYLTANVQFETDRRSGVLLVPNAAWRWKPQPSQVDPASKAADSAESPGAKDQGTLWVEAGNGRVRPLKVAVGASDGAMTEISGSGVSENVSVVVGEEATDDTSGPEGAPPPGKDSGAPQGKDETGSPFLPKPPKGARPPPGPPM